MGLSTTVPPQRTAISKMPALGNTLPEKLHVDEGDRHVLSDVGYKMLMRYAPLICSVISGSSAATAAVVIGATIINRCRINAVDLTYSLS